MDATEVATAAMGAATIVLAVAVSVPQVWSLLGGRGAHGVSIPSLGCSTISFAAWTVHAAQIGDRWLLASSILGVPGQALATWLAWRYGARRQGLWVPALWLALVTVALVTDAAAGTTFGAVAVGSSILWMVAPAVYQAWRSSDVSGIAAGSWWVLVGEGGLFLGYGLAADVDASVLYGTICLLGSTCILARLAADRVVPTPLVRRLLPSR